MSTRSSQRVKTRVKMPAAKAPGKAAKTAKQRAREFRARQRALRSGSPLSPLPPAEYPVTDNEETETEPSTSKRKIRKRASNRKYLPYSKFEANEASHRYFKQKFYDNPFGAVCEICDRLWFQSELKALLPAHVELLARKFPGQDVSKFKACKWCVQSLIRGHIPTFAKFNGFKYPEKPAHLPRLDSLSERLISPRIPFLQIRRLQNVKNHHDIVGQIINVPMLDNNMVYHLPRNMYEDCCINVNIDERRFYPSTDLIDLINKQDIQAWLQYLVTTPLYTTYNVNIDDSFFDDKNFNDTPRVVVSENIPQSAALVAQQQSLLWNVDKYMQNAPSEGDMPYSTLFDDHAEELAFPSIYLGEFRIFKDGFRVTPFTMVSSELRRADRRGVTPQHLLYMAMKIMRLRVHDALIATRSISNDPNSTKEQLQSEEYLSQSLETNLAFLKCIPNSTWHWTERKRDLFTMLRQLGKPTMSMTLSADEIGWVPLVRILYQLQNRCEISAQQANNNLDALQRSILVNEDAVTCALYFNKLLNVLMSILTSKIRNPFEQYHVTHYFQHIEFPADGSPQAHFLLWMEKAPKDALGANKKAAITLIDKLISVSTKEASKIIKHQIHRHSSRCYTREYGNESEVCRFGAPFMPCKSTMILEPMPKTDPRFAMNLEAYNNIRRNLETTDYGDIDEFYDLNDISGDEHYMDILRAGITRPKVFLKRALSEKWHESFNPFVFNVLRANMNIEFIPDEFSCADFVVDYISKADRGMSDLRQRIIKTMNEHPDFDINEITKGLSVDILNTIETTTQEAAWYLLREPTSMTSCGVIQIPTVRPEERPKFKKNNYQLAALDIDDESPDFWRESWFDKYEKRPEELEDVTLAQFVANYTRNHTINAYVKRKDPCLIRYRSYDMTKHPDEYKREMVTLHVPFRNEELEILADNRYRQLYIENEDVIFLNRREFESDFDVQKTLDKFNRLFRGEDIVDETPERPRLVPVEPEESDPLAGLGEPGIPDMNWEFRGDATAIAGPSVNFVPAPSFRKPVVVKIEEPEEPPMHPVFKLLPKNSPFQVFLSGPVACGKTFIIRIMTEIYNRYKNAVGHCKVFTNYTPTNRNGSAIDDTNIYTTLKISISKLLPISINEAERYRELFDHVQILIIDGMSTIGAEVVSNINKRLRQITGNFDINFGGVNIIVVGELRQSILASALTIHSSLLNTLKFLELEKVMDQSNELFTLIQTKLREGAILEDSELRLLESRFFSEEEIDRFCHHGIRICATNESATEYNQAILDSAGSKIVSVANDICIGCHPMDQPAFLQKFLKMSIAETRGLPYEIIFVLQKLYMVTTNIDPTLGLVAGALGRLVCIERDAAGEVTKVWLELLNPVKVTGKKRKRVGPSPQVKGLGDKAVPLGRRRWNIPMNEGKTIIATRDHFPLVAACALSLEKTEGMNFDQIVYEYNQIHPQQVICRALSRVNKVTGLYIVSTSNNRKFNHGRNTQSPIMYQQAETIEIPDDKSMTINKVLIDFIISRTTLSVLSFDPQSRRIQSADLNEVVTKKPGILLLLETCPDDEDKLKVPDFNCEMRFKSSKERNRSVAIHRETNDRTNVVTTHMDVNFRQSTSLIANASEVGEICGARCTLDNDKSIITVMVYVLPNQRVIKVLEFLHEVLLAYTVQGAFLLRKDSDKVPMILGGHFNIDFASPEAQILIKFLNAQFNLHINNDPAISRSASGTTIDAVFSRNLDQLRSTSYVLYSSFERPRVTFPGCQPMDIS